MVIYALFAANTYEQTNLLGLYASKEEAVDAATEFLRTEDGEGFRDGLSRTGLYVETRILGESPEVGGVRGSQHLTWLTVDPTAEGAPFATIDE